MDSSPPPPPPPTTPIHTSKSTGTTSPQGNASIGIPNTTSTIHTNQQWMKSHIHPLTPPSMHTSIQAFSTNTTNTTPQPHDNGVHQSSHTSHTISSHTISSHTSTSTSTSTTTNPITLIQTNFSQSPITTMATPTTHTAHTN
uniref:hypothetical protein n=1 Tax=Saccharomycopsis fibuligera TaxID=4944 RepID=UPI002A80FBF6|nr:hypothetical protein UYS03_mgp16 [Saccharomycopsis fibuligera]WPA89483.1 hypothetical protein [Saccharomycopsis fibuligera]